MIAEYTTGQVQSGGTSYLTTDHLGSTRLVTDASGAVKARHDYLPFGEETGAGIGSRTAGMGYGVMDSTRQRFTSKERDQESGLDYFLARYYSAAQGRFTSPDEFTGGPDELYDFAEAASSNPTFYADIFEPQTLNKYQYCLNNPFKYIDPDGHQEKKSLTQRLKEAARETILGAASAFLEDNGVPVEPQGNSVGRAIGHSVAIVQGVSEIIAGATLITGGGAEAVVTAPAAVTGVGAAIPAVGVGAVVVGVAVVTHGTGVLVNTIHNATKKDATKKNLEVQGSAEGAVSKPQKIDPKTQKPRKDRSTEGTTSQREDIEKARDKNRKLGKPDKIKSIEKSKQDEKTALKRIKSLKDVE